MGRSTLLSPYIERGDLRAPPQAALATLIVGEPGIGKTRLLHEWGDIAVAEGAMRVAITLFDASARGRYEVLREIVRALGRVETPADSDAAYLRFVRATLAEASASTQLCIAIDDICRAASATLDALAYLVDRLQDLPIRWLFVSRNDRGVTRAFSGLARAGLLQTHELPPLTRDESDRLARVVDPTLDESRLAQIHARSGGNALFVELLAAGDDVWTAETLRTAVGDRLSELGETALRLARFVATGNLVTINRLAVAARMSPSSIRKACDELLERAILIRDGDVLRFRHDLVAESTIWDASSASLDAAYDAWWTLASDANERMRCLEGAGRWSEYIDEALDAGWRTIQERQLGAEAEALASRVLAIAPVADSRRFLAFALRARARLEDGCLAEARFHRLFKRSRPNRRRAFRRGVRSIRRSCGARFRSQRPAATRRTLRRSRP